MSSKHKCLILLTKYNNSLKKNLYNAKDTDGREVPFAVSLKLDTSICDLKTESRLIL